MATRTVTGVVKKSNGGFWAEARVRFQLIGGAYTTSPAETYPAEPVIAVTDLSGAFSVTLAADLGTPYEVTMPDRETFRILVPAGSATTVEALRDAYTGS